MSSTRPRSSAWRCCAAIPATSTRCICLGVICTNHGRHADGVSYLLRAEAIRPDEGRLHANLGSAYGAVQRFDKAIEAYRRAIDQDHRNAGLLNNLGLAYADSTMRTPIETFRDASD